MPQVTILRAQTVGDAVTVTGTVDGVPAQVQVWKSHLNTLSTKAARVTYVAQQLKAAADAATGQAGTAEDLSATVTVP